ncbi:hypothetical protein L1F30_16480 [Simiduia sp. 21SJ11W-1]|uniref:hypothetical protein n=1 Tax=Simiduia sp. 21SJ11W-1 TaxID=2909669 RepID=UPI00209E6F7E|nr:hypothetical protein [Simiduia sp. 21SJ11W-1]UTA47739.1 hypothetical protein L1F30_16480 [Simiduia sp. 21SJ11W-1]
MSHTEDHSPHTTPNPAANGRAGEEPTLEETLSQGLAEAQQWLAKLDALASLGAAWAINLQAIARLELERNVQAVRQALIIQLMLIPFTVLMLISLSVAAGWLTFEATQSSALGFLALIATQVFTLLCGYWRQRYLRSQLGFAQTRKQLQEAKSDVVSAFKQPH